MNDQSSEEILKFSFFQRTKFSQKSFPLNSSSSTNHFVIYFSFLFAYFSHSHFWRRKKREEKGKIKFISHQVANNKQHTHEARERRKWFQEEELIFEGVLFQQ